ncbi:ABC transporter ATP-binding protein [Caldanaerobacter subterraneus]|uniref:ABC-2 type transport system ATP-binding protein n=1 Tax=Caldanaerobacter subterraneus TaxID=911092 RepID=A0A4R2JTV4_9THEO|nr:ABC transporter ATP-binding protein [Caldanaerobacter subterraneus]TCO60419.1 ABC-2 type transport system ATP-binding protein [Caldanaerobacter subterraneus]
MSELIVETQGLTKKYGNFTAVDGIDLKVKKGEIYGFLGPNGAGKSTTIRMLLGLIKPTRGDARLFGLSIRQNPMEILKRVGAIVESPSYYGNLTAAENLEITRKILGADKKEIDRVLEIVNLSQWKNKKVKNFSLGMKQRLAIAQALLGKRELLILDEPTNGLDPAGIHEIRQLIKNLPGMLGVTVLMSSHILREVELMATSVGIISRGRLLFQGTLEELKAKSEQDVCIEVYPQDKALKFLENKGLKVKVNDNRLFIKKNGINVAAVNKALVMEGFEVTHLSVVAKNLEDIFLEVTGGDAL